MGNKYGGIDEATVRVIMGVEEAYLDAARRSLTDRFGSADAYLEQVLGVDAPMREVLKAQLVDA